MSEINDKNLYKSDERVNPPLEAQGYNRVDITKLNFNPKIVSSEEALSDVTPFQWSEDVLNRKKKVIIK